MKFKNILSYLKKTTPYFMVILIVVIGIQTWLLAKAYQDSKTEIREAPTPLMTPGFNIPAPTLDPFSLWNHDPFQSNVFPSPWDPNDWDPFGTMQYMQDRMQHFFQEDWDKFSFNSGLGHPLGQKTYTPEVELTEEDDHYTVIIHLPNAENSNLSVTCENQQLTISGTMEQTRKDQSGTDIFQQHQSSRFSQTIPLAAPVDTQNMHTDYEQDRAIVTIPKIIP